MKRIIFLSVFLFINCVYAQENSDTLFFKFGKYEYKYGDFILPYRLLVPIDYTPSDTVRYPLILFLHGAGERGTDNERQLTHIAKIVAVDSFRRKYPSFVLAPQCPEQMRWVEVDWGLLAHKIPDTPSVAMAATIGLLDSIISVYNIDTDRMYVTGLSMGGFGTWDVIARYPEKFAAAVPICGGADLATAPRIAHIPIWVFHGAKDRVVSVSRSRNMVRELKKYGGNPIYTEYPNVYHGAWYPAYQTPELFEWLFGQNKKNNSYRIRKRRYLKKY